MVLDCCGTIKIENTLTSGSHYDPVNIHGTHLRVVESEGHKLKVRFMHHQTRGFEAFEVGDSIGFVDNKNLLVYDYTVVKKAHMLTKREMELELNKPVSTGLKENHCIENITKTPEVIIRDNRFEHTNTRGLLVTTRRRVLVENNTFFRTGMHAILIANDCNFWFESGPVQDVTIRKNRFIECGYNSLPNSYPIAIMPETGNFVNNKFVHSNITIEENEFKVFDSPVLFARSTKNLTFEGNTISGGYNEVFSSDRKPMFYLEHCYQVTVKQNYLNTIEQNADIKLVHMDTNQLEIDSEEDYTIIPD